ncbi:MAG: D-2-hydroxyacid dehydrogenase [Burkholderiaceae bacterium]|nr:D-2-hydroxyacid dehydrogenase [Burkholderiaceae bacterium]
MQSETKPGVVVLSSDAGRHVARLTPRFPDFSFDPCPAYADLPALLERRAPKIALAFKIPGAPFPRQDLIERGKVSWIHVCGAGVDHVLPWDPSRLTVTNSSGIHGDIMAQYVLGAMIGFNHHARRYFLQQARNKWSAGESRTIEGQTLTVIGFGSVGSAVGDLAARAGMKVIGVRARPQAGASAGVVVGVDRMEWAASQADHLAICLPLAPGTRGIIGERVLAALAPGAHLVNVSRGGVVDEAALLRALKAGRIAGATLDVFEKEPLPADSPFWDMENVTVTPHSSSDIEGWQDRAVALFSENLARWEKGEALRNVVDPARGY